MWLSLLASFAAPSLAAGTLGVDWVPFDRSDLIWVEEDQSSDTLVGEFDGMVRPALSAYGGWMGGKNAWLFGLGAARTSTVTWDGEGYRRVSATGVRPSADWQRYLSPRELGGACFWLGLGLYGTLPFANDAADVYTEEEQSDADEGSRALRGRIGGVGGRAGLGGDYLFTDDLSLGLRYHLTAHRGQVAAEDSLSVSWLTWGEAALRLQLEF